MSWRASLRYTEALPRPSLNPAPRNTHNIASFGGQHTRNIAVVVLSVQGFICEYVCTPGASLGHRETSRGHQITRD